MNLLVRKLAGGSMCWFCVPDVTQFAKVVPYFLIVKIITVFELVRGHTQFNQSMARSPLSESVDQYNSVI